MIFQYYIVNSKEHYFFFFAQFQNSSRIILTREWGKIGRSKKTVLCCDFITECMELGHFTIFNIYFHPNLSCSHFILQVNL